MNIDYTLWTNTDGNLGEIKVQIPDGVTITWPEGDALVGNFVYKDGLISGFVDTKALIMNEGKTSTIPYDYVNIHLASIQEGEMEVIGGERTKYFTVTYGTGNVGDTIVLGTKYLGCKTVSDVRAVEPDYRTVDVIDGAWTESLANLEDGYYMFFYCSSLTSFTSDLSSLTNGKEMFEGCSSLATFTTNLSSLTNGDTMFYDCSELTTFTSDLSSLETGNYMFMYCYNLTTFTSNLSSLVVGGSMFYDCSELTTFTSDLSSLIIGENMFGNCSKLTSFTSDLSSLTYGNEMFSGCKLDTASVQQIAKTINPYNGRIDIGIANTTPNSEETAAFNNMSGKGWTVYVNGSSWSSAPNPYVLVDETTTETPIPFYAKPIEVEEDKAKYVGEDGKFYDILGAQFIYGDDLSTYGMFLNKEDAAANMRLTKIERN